MGESRGPTARFTRSPAALAHGAALAQSVVVLYLPLNTSTFHFHGGSFRPSGPILWGNISPRWAPGREGRTRPNPSRSFGRPLAARIFVGFNVGIKTRWSLPELIEMVHDVLVEQTGSASATFAGQTGIYTHFDGKMVVEPGAQVWIMDERGRTRAAFQKQMLALAEAVRARLQQESVLVEIQRGGVTLDTLSVYEGPEVPPKRRRRAVTKKPARTTRSR